jgi:hypothetical protein
MTYPWIKLYTETLHDPKIARCTPAEKWCWIGLLLLAGESGRQGAIEITSGEPYTIAELTRLLDLDQKTMHEALSKFHRLRMVSTAPGGTIHITNWEKRQAKPADAPERVRERVRDYRARRRADSAPCAAPWPIGETRPRATPAAGNTPVTPPVTDVTGIEEDKRADQTRTRALPSKGERDVWDRVLQSISLQMTQATFYTWFKTCRGEPDEATHTLKILAPSPNHAVWIAKRLNNHVTRGVEETLGKDWKWEITN